MMGTFDDTDTERAVGLGTTLTHVAFGLLRPF